MSLKDVLHKILDVAAGGSARPDLHDEIDGLEDSAVEPAPGVPAEDAAPEPVSEPVPVPEPAPVDDGAQVQAQVQEGDGGEADA